MFKNYIKIAFRNVIRHKAFTAINVIGLVTGIAACLLLFTVVRYELSYDTFQKNYSNIYRVVTQDKYADGVSFTPGVPFPALEALRTDFPNITSGAIYSSAGSQVTVLNNDASVPSAPKKFIESTDFFFADPQFFHIFQYNWLAGNPKVLQEPNVTVLAQKMAEKYFGNWRNAVGKFLKLDNAVTVKVGGVIENVPANTDFPLGVVSSFLTMKNTPLYHYTDEWGSTTSNFQVYMLLPPNVSAKTINEQLLQFDKKNLNNHGRSVKTNFLQPLKDLHYDNRFDIFGDHITDKSTLWTLSLIGVFIIIMACINFVNLSTAQAVGRSKEVGIRKVLGGNRKQLFLQVLGETGLIVLFALLLALVVGEVCLPFIKHIASIEEYLTLFNLQTALFLVVIFVVVTLFAGLYPAFVLSGFTPALALKNKMTSASVGGISLRRGLVVLQFSISQILIIGTIVAVSQMNYIRNADLGFNKEAVLVINTNADSTVYSRQEAFKQKLLNTPGVETVSFGSDVPSSDNNWSGNFAYDHRDDENFSLFLKFGDEDYLKTYGLKLVAGRNYSKSDTTNEVLINETLVKKLGVKNPEEVIGKELRLGRSPWRTIVGVVRDFKANSLREEMHPIMIAENRKSYYATGVKLRSSNLAKTQAAVEAAWNEYFPEYAYTTSYLEDNINDFYRQEAQLSLLYKIFAGIAIFISCLGLYGLVSFMSVQRTKEIGVRKVLGASVQHIIYLFSKEFTVLILIGFVIATPVAYYIMHNWLQSFVYRVDITAWVFILAVIVSVVVAWITVGYKSFKAANANPVDSLKVE